MALHDRVSTNTTGTNSNDSRISSVESDVTDIQNSIVSGSIPFTNADYTVNSGTMTGGGTVNYEISGKILMLHMEISIPATTFEITFPDTFLTNVVGSIEGYYVFNDGFIRRNNLTVYNGTVRYFAGVAPQFIINKDSSTSSGTGHWTAGPFKLV